MPKVQNILEDVARGNSKYLFWGKGSVERKKYPKE